MNDDSFRLYFAFFTSPEIDTTLLNFQHGPHTRTSNDEIPNRQIGKIGIGITQFTSIEIEQLDVYPRIRPFSTSGDMRSIADLIQVE
jgi:hypothetical protein